MNHSNPGLLRLLPSVVAMAVVILASNVLVQYPIDHTIALGGLRIDLAELLTWGAFTYPVAFLVTDTTNRICGMQSARRVVYVGFALGVALSLFAAFGIAAEVASAEGISLLSALTSDDGAFSMLRIALASGTAFLIGQLLDVAIFDRLRTATWWKAPAVSSFFGSLSDTAIFFSLAFAGTGQPWIGWAFGDFAVKLLMVALLLYPFRLIVNSAPARLSPSNT
jgi:queuosine precursor transporter